MKNKFSRIKVFVTNSYILLFLTVFLVVGRACIDDKGNYEYIELSEAVIANANSDGYVYVSPNSILHIEPSITYTEGKGYDDYSFEWHKYNSLRQTEMILQSGDTPELNVTLPPSMNKSGSYSVMFFAKNNQTGVRFSRRYVIVVRNTMQSGYLALVEKSNGLELDMIARFNDTLTLYRDVLQLTGSEYPRIGRRPIGLATFADETAPTPYDSNSSRTKYSVYLITDKGTDRLKPEDFSFIEDDYNISKVSVIGNKFLPPEGLVPEKMEYHYFDGRQYIYLNKYWFFASRTGMVRFYMDPINTPYAETNYYTPSPYMVNGGYSAVLYDMDHNRFMFQRAFITELNSSKECLSTRTLADNANDKYKFNDPDYELVYMGHITQATMSSTAFAVLKHKRTGVHEVWTFTYTFSSVTKTDRFILPSTLDYSTNKFVHHPSLKYLYYATDDEIYMFAMTSLDLTAIDISDVVPSGHKISLFNTLISTKVGGRTLFSLGTYDPTMPIDECGNMRLFTVDSYTGKFTLANHPALPTGSGYQIPMEWDGLGKIIAFDYKER